MHKRFLLTILTVTFALLTFGCSDSSNQDTVTGKGSIRALHAIPNIGSVNFLIEETSLGVISFRGASGISQYDDLKYVFKFEITLPDDDVEEPTELATRTLKVTSEQEYTFVLGGELDNPQLFIWEQFGRDWVDELNTAADNDTEVTVMEVSFGHIASDLGQVDVYLEAPGTSPLAATPKATLGYSEFNPAVELTAGDYQLVVTPAGNPNTFLYASNPFAITAATSTLLTLLDDGGFTTADIAVSLIGAGSGIDLTDINATAVLSAIHVALGTFPLDIYDSGDFSVPIIDDLSFGSRSAEVNFEAGTLPITVTPADNLGAFLGQGNINLFDGSYNRLYLTGLPGFLQILTQRYDYSTVATHARLQLFQTAVRLAAVDIYIVDPDTDIQLIGPNYSSVAYAGGFGYTNMEEGLYNVYITEPATKNILAGPLQIDLQKSSNYSLVVTDSANLSAADMMFFETRRPRDQGLTDF